MDYFALAAALSRAHAAALAAGRAEQEPAPDLQNLPCHTENYQRRADMSTRYYQVSSAQRLAIAQAILQAMAHTRYAGRIEWLTAEDKAVAEQALHECLRIAEQQAWPEGAEHQRWLDTADAREIADWALTIFEDEQLAAQADKEG